MCHELSCILYFVCYDFHSNISLFGIQICFDLSEILFQWIKILCQLHKNYLIINKTLFKRMFSIRRNIFYLFSVIILYQVVLFLWFFFCYKGGILRMVKIWWWDLWENQETEFLMASAPYWSRFFKITFITYFKTSYNPKQ